jgi:hypothetical protein
LYALFLTVSAAVSLFDLAPNILERSGLIAVERTVFVVLAWPRALLGFLLAL